MNKSIYEEAIEILLNMGTEFISVPCNPIGEENSDMIHLRDVTETYEPNMHEVVKALEQAQKQEKLLDMYREYFRLNSVPKSEWTTLIFNRLLEVQKEIKELEK